MVKETAKTTWGKRAVDYSTSHPFLTMLVKKKVLALNSSDRLGCMGVSVIRGSGMLASHPLGGASVVWASSGTS